MSLKTTLVILFLALSAYGHEYHTVIIQNGRIVPNPLYAYQGHGYYYDTVEGDNDLPWLRQYAIDSGLFSGIDMTQDWKKRELEMMEALVDYTANLFHWTGSDQYGPFLGRAKAILQQTAADPDSNWSCGSISLTGSGLAQAHGIPARAAAGHLDGPGADVTIEMYSTTVNRWLQFLPHTAGWFGDLHVGRLGVHEIKQFDDMGMNLRTGAILPLLHLPDETYDRAPVSPFNSNHWWEGYYAHPSVSYINRLQCLPGLGLRKFDYVAWDDWLNVNYGKNWPVFTDIDDVNAPINNVVASVEVVSDTAVITLTHNMREFVRYEASTNGSAWQTVTSPFDWTPDPNDELIIRGVGLGDVHSPDVGIKHVMIGDINGDSTVDLADFSIFAICFGTTVEQPACQEQEAILSDLDESGTINLVDFATFANQFNV